MSIFCDLKHYCCMNILAKNICGLVVSFMVTGGRSCSFQTPIWKCLTQNKRSYLSLYSTILCAGSVATYVK